MASLISAISVSSNSPVLPAGWPGLALQVLSKVHRVWRIARKSSQIYLKPENLKLLLIGRSVVRPLVGQNRELRAAAQALLIARYVMDVIREGHICFERFDEVKATLHQRPSIKPLPLSELRKQWWTKLLSPAQAMGVQLKLAGLKDRIRLIAKACWELLKQIFVLSMNLADLTDACRADPSVQDEALDESLIHASHLMESVVNHREAIIRSLESNQTHVQNVLHWVGSPMQAEELTAKVDTAILWIDRTYLRTRQVAQAGENALREGSQAFLYSFGLGSLIV